MGTPSLCCRSNGPEIRYDSPVQGDGQDDILLLFGRLSVKIIDFVDDCFQT